MGSSQVGDQAVARTTDQISLNDQHCGSAGQKLWECAYTAAPPKLQEVREATQPLTEQQLKAREANRLAPSADKLNTALTPQVRADMQAAGLRDQTPEQLRQGIIQAMEQDPGLTGATMEKMKNAPVGAPYEATGAVTPAQMADVLQQQKTDRQHDLSDPNLQALKQSDPAEYQKRTGQIFKSTDVGSILRQKAAADPINYDIRKIEAADELITNLQKH